MLLLIRRKCREEQSERSHVQHIALAHSCLYEVCSSGLLLDQTGFLHACYTPLPGNNLVAFSTTLFFCWAHTTTTTTAVYTFLFSLNSCKPPLHLSVTASSHKTASNAVPLQQSRKSTSRTSLPMKSISSSLSPLVIEPSRGPGMVDLRKSSPFASGNRYTSSISINRGTVGWLLSSFTATLRRV